MLISNPFCHVFNGFEISIKVSFYTHIEFTTNNLCSMQYFLKTFDPNAHETAQINEEVCLRITFGIHFLEAYFFFKNVKIVVPYCTI
jgi:hypothetical protein